MSTIDMIADDRADRLLETAFERATGGRINSPNTLQRALFPRLLSHDTGLLVPTAAGAGRLEAIFVPAMTWSEFDDNRPRLFIVVPDWALMDDYEFRLIPYLQSLSAFDSFPRTAYFGDRLKQSTCRRFFPDGSIESLSCVQPLDCNVDLCVLRFSEFRSLFFSDGSARQECACHDSNANNRGTARADLTYFDDTVDYSPEQLSVFLQLVKFLYARGSDVIVGSAALSEVVIEHLSFLETLYVPDANEEPARTIQAVNRATWTAEAVGELLAQSEQTIFVADSPRGAQDFDDLIAPHCSPTHYYSSMPARARNEVYSNLRHCETTGAEYLCIADARALESADLSASGERGAATAIATTKRDRLSC